MTAAAEVIARAEAAGLRLRPRGDRVGVAPAGALSPDLHRLLLEHRDAVLAELRHREAVTALEALAERAGIPWPVARAQLVPGDAEAGHEQLHADEGDGREVAGVVLWLRLLADRAQGKIP